MSFIKNMNYEEKTNFRTAIISVVMMAVIFTGEVWVYNKSNMFYYTWKILGGNILMTVVTTFFILLLEIEIAYIYGCIPCGWRISKDKMPHLDGWVLVMPIISWMILGYLKFVLRVILSVVWGVVSFPGYLLGSKYPKLKNKKMCGICTMIAIVIISMSIGVVDVATEKISRASKEKMGTNYEEQVETYNYY